MSEAAPQTAPGQVEVGAGAPAPAATEVAPASGSTATPAAPQTAPAGYVSEERFNGLMSMLHQTQNALTAAQSVQTAPAPAAPAAAPEASLAEANRLAALEQEIGSMRVEAAVQQAVKTFPAIERFADLLVGETPQDIYALAAEFNERLNSGSQAPTTTTETPAAPAATAPVVPVLPSSPPSSPVNDDHMEALTADVKAKKPGAFGKWMQAQFERQQATQIVE